ncbi:unnamed protein product [Echinostoma caproni]|uniref:PK_Tyr_Ser-Thr domain-containing protein n=1 Tax=Echinostoma caproni TaxID=27848 RepID=A0A183AYE2_9TREM|nr:unnamed protein product [Echinostoma caproni]
MTHCWVFDPHNRPTFHDLCVLLGPRFGDEEFRAASFFYSGDVPVPDPATVSTTGPMSTHIPAVRRGPCISRNAHIRSGSETTNAVQPTHHPFHSIRNPDHMAFTDEDDTEQLNKREISIH